MKALKHFLLIVVVMALVGGANQGFAKSQMLKWYFPGSVVDFRGDYPTVSSLPGPDTGSISNGICWNTGKTLFYIIDGAAYDKNGDIIDWIGVVGTKEIAIVPFPKNPDKFYVFVCWYETVYYYVFEKKWGLNPQGGFFKVVTIDWDLFAELEGACNAVGLAVSKPINEQGEHYLYVATSHEIKRWTVGNEIYDQQSVVDEEELPGHPRFSPSELELSPDGMKLAGTMSTKGWGSRRVFVIELDSENGLYTYDVSSYHLYDLIYECPSWNYPYICGGLEFSGDASKLYASFHLPAEDCTSPPPVKEGIYWIDLSLPPEQRLWQLVPDSEDYCYSQLELARKVNFYTNELIYAASTTDVLRGIDTTINLFSADENTTITGINIPNSYQASYHSGGGKVDQRWFYVTHKLLPDQIDGYNYASILDPRYRPIELLPWDDEWVVVMDFEEYPGGLKGTKRLKWGGICPAVSAFDVYLGTSYDDVNDATPVDPTVYKGQVVDNSYQATGLELGTTYYWRVDGVNDVNVDSPWKGYIWSFTTKSCIRAPLNMTAWWTFDENTGITADDSAGTINDQGTLTNGASFTPGGKVAGGLQLDGLDDFVEVADSPELNFGTGDLSMDAWVKTSAASGGRVILDKREGTVSNPRGYVWYVYNGNLGFELADGTLTNYGSSLFVADGSWHHVAVTVDRDDPNGLVLYVDGVSATRDPTDRTGSLTNDHDLLIGEDCLGISSNFSGEIDEVELYRRALSSVEIKAIFVAGSAGKCKREPRWSCCPKGDLNEDGIVDFKDFAIIADNWLQTGVWR